MQATDGSRAVMRFGSCQLHLTRRELLVDGTPVHIGSRAFDILQLLVEARGQLVTKDEILTRVWPGRVVEENTLQFQISTLRKALGEDRSVLKTISGHGYRFAAEITAAGSEAEAPAERGVAPAAHRGDARSETNIPASTSELIGREADRSEVVKLVAAHRLVTLIGAGGIGKTRLGLEVARDLLPKFADGVWVAELAPLSDPELVPVTVAAALGLELPTGRVSSKRIAAALRSKQILLVLDNCEHVIEAAAGMAEVLLRATSATIMVTSREPLRAEGECIYRVPPLDVPAEGVQDIEDLLRHGAVRLFVARARAAEPSFSADIRIAAAAAAICRRLDGIPLAIELAAARAATLGVEGLAARLDDRFGVLTGGRRTALPRHQTLRATLDWSYELLSDPERVVLRRLGIFSGSFTLEAASAIAASAEIAVSEVLDRVANLVTKSLVMADHGGTTMRYRLLETTRAYAREKLGESEEFESVARRHAEYHRKLFELAEAEWETRPPAEWQATYGRRIDDVRAALDWAFSPTGDASIGIALTVSSVPLWFQLSLLDECRGRVQRALSNLARASSRDARGEMKLNAALGTSLLISKGPAPDGGTAWTNALGLAQSLDDTEYQLQAYCGLWGYRISSGEARRALAFAQKFSSLAAHKAAPVDLFFGDQMIGIVLHILGDQTDARAHIDRALSRHVAVVHRSRTVRFHIDPRVRTHGILGHILWLQGFPEQAMRAAHRAIETARAIDHAVSQCYTLAETACPVALLSGDLDAAERFVAMMLDYSARHALLLGDAWGRYFKALVLIKRGDVVTGLPLLRSAIDEIREVGCGVYHTTLLGGLAEGLASAGQIAEGLATIEEALALCERTEERWCIADLLRINGELVLAQGAPRGAGEAEKRFRQALDWARRQETLSWELRAATSLSRLWRQQGRSEEAYELLAPVYERFTEGFGTVDLKTAKALLDTPRYRLPESFDFL
jgi:predicted ATPase/DNA-binding winged helix-turn-helix (wHTH) protein